MFNIDLTDKTVAVTGASQGIGKSISEIFAENSASVILLSRNKSKLEKNTKELISKGYKAKYFVLDVSQNNEVEKVFKEIGSVDILINNAGIYFTSSVQDMDIKKWKELLDINLDGAMFCSKAVIESMTKKKAGRIINISSVSGKFGDAYSSAYCASKFALIGFTQSLANEVARYKITANCICPGWVETKMAEGILHDEELKTNSLEAVPIGRYVQPKEIGYLALYLASDYASAITGQAINICGGLCMH